MCYAHCHFYSVVKTELENHLLADLGPNASVAIAERNSSQGGLLDRNDLIKSLYKVNWTTELKDGRVPMLTPSHDTKSRSVMLGRWKSEEFSKFILVAPVVLRELVPQKAYPSGCVSKGGHKNIANTCNFFCGSTQLCMKNSIGCRHVQKTLNIPCICQMILYVIQPWTTIDVSCMSVKYAIINVKRRTTSPSARHTLTVHNSFTL